MEHRNNFDLLRLLAAAQVMLIHSYDWLGAPIGIGTLHFLDAFPGVAIFFVISGFLVSRSWLNPAMTKPIFADHRIRRIYPALWVNLTVILVMLYCAGCLAYKGPIRFPLWTLVTFITGSDWIGAAVASNVVTPGFYKVFPSGVLWTIPVELCFYLLVPTIFARKFTSRREIGLSILKWSVASIIVHFIWTKTGHPYSIIKYLWIFLFGAALNLYWDHVKPLLVGKAMLWIPGYVSLIYLTRFAGYEFNYTTASPLNIIEMLALGCAAISFAYSFRALRPMLFGQDISYGLYLWHMPVIYTMAGFGLKGTWFWAIAAYAAAAVIAFLSWRLIEHPILKRKQRIPVSKHPQDFVEDYCRLDDSKCSTGATLRRAGKS